MVVVGMLLVALGALIAFLGMAGGEAGIAVAWPAGGALFGLGILLIVAGIINNSINRQGEATRAALLASQAEFKQGIESLWAQFARMRVSTGSEQIPPQARAPTLTGAAAGMGYCPQCRKLRHSSIPACIYCDSKAPVEFKLPT